MLQIKTVRTAGGEIKYGKVLPNPKAGKDIAVSQTFSMPASEDVEIITTTNWRRGTVRRAERTDRRRAKEEEQRRQLDCVATMGLIALIVTAFGLGACFPDAKLLIGVDIAAIFGIIWRWLA